jgi:hypothetical protein
VPQGSFRYATHNETIHHFPFVTNMLSLTRLPQGRRTVQKLKRGEKKEMIALRDTSGHLVAACVVSPLIRIHRRPIPIFPPLVCAHSHTSTHTPKIPCLILAVGQAFSLLRASARPVPLAIIWRDRALEAHRPGADYSPRERTPIARYRTGLNPGMGGRGRQDRCSPCGPLRSTRDPR